MKPILVVSGYGTSVYRGKPVPVKTFNPRPWTRKKKGRG